MADETSQPTGGDPPAETQPMQPLVAPGSAPDGSQDGAPADWNPPKVNEQGFAVDADGIPLNLRLRALHLADAGEKEDPANAVSPVAITQAADRLAEYDGQYPSLDGMTKAALQKQAEAENVAVADDAKRDDIQAAIEAARPVRI